MKKTDFIRCMDSIDPRYVREAENYKPTSRVSVKILSLAACLAIIVTAVPVAVMLNREDVSDKPVITTPVEDIVVTPGGENEEDKNKNVIYCGSDLEISEDLIKNAFHNEEVEILDSQKYRHYFDSPVIGGKGPAEILNPDVNVPAELKFTVGGQEIYATLDLVYLTSDTVFYGTEFAKENGKIARYTIKTINGEEPLVYDYYRGSDDDRKMDLKVYYRIATKEIIKIEMIDGSRVQHFVDPEADIELSESEIMAIAEKDASLLYGEDLLSKFRANITSSFVEVYYKGGFWQHEVEFQRHFDGHESGESFTLTYDDLGRFCGLSTDSLHSLENVTNEALQEAEERAAIILDGKLLTGRYVVEVSADGSVFVKCFYYTGKVNPNGKLDTSLIYVKVNVD